MSEPSTRQCVVHHKPTEARHGLLCTNHFERLGIMLRDVEDEACLLSPMPSMAMRNDVGGGSLASTRTPARLDILVHTDRRRGTGRSETEDDALAAGQTLPILDVLHSWARVVREERNYADRSQVTIAGERDTLTRALDWIAAQPWIDECYDDVKQLLGQLRAANGHRAEKPYSACPVILDGNACTGSVWVRDETQPVWRRYADRCSRTWEPAPGSAVCDTCGSAWVTEADKARLRRMVDDAASEAARPRTNDGRRMLTAAELVAQGIVSTINNARVIAHRKRIVSVNGHYDPDHFVNDSKLTA